MGAQLFGCTTLPTRLEVHSVRRMDPPEVARMAEAGSLGDITERVKGNSHVQAEVGVHPR
jgi:hypothetical protein